MKTLADIFLDAITADADLHEATNGNIVSTCFEIPPDELDNTPLPNIIVTNDGFQNNYDTKDDVWESNVDMVQASVDVAASTPKEVDGLVAKVRAAIQSYILDMYEDDENIPELQPGFPSSQGIEWDWIKPCYYQKITYQCIIQKTDDDEQD